MQCGREPGGKQTREQGVCRASVARWLHGTNAGKNAGRYCWFAAGTLSDEEVTCTHALQIGDCTRCLFYRLVEDDEDRFFVVSTHTTRTR